MTIQAPRGGPIAQIIDENVVFAPGLGALNFLGAGVSAVANPSTGAIDVTIPGGGSSNPVWNTLEKSADYVIVAGDITGTGCYVKVDSSGGAITITLPAVSACSAGQQVAVKRRGSNGVTVVRAGADTIDGATSDALLLDYESATYARPLSGADWAVL